jgi:PAS domain S-box-containing protein
MDVPGRGNPEDREGSGNSALTQQTIEEEQVNLYKCLFDRMNDAVAYCKALYSEKGEPVDFILLDINTAFKRMIRVPEKMIVGKKATQFLPILTRFHMDWMEKAARVVLTRKSVSFEKYIPILNKWLLFSGFSPQKGYFAMIIKDVTWRKRIEEALRQGEKKYKKLANSITDPFFAVDSSLKVTYWNRASETVMGLRGADVVGRHYFEVFGRSKVTRKTAGVFLDVMRTRKPRTLTDNLPRVDKATLFEVEVYPTGNGIAVLAKDITERKKQQQSLEGYAQRLEELVKSRTEKLKNAERLATIGETAGMIGHDIRNPLQSIIGEVYLAKNELAELPETEAKKSLLDSVSYIEEQTLYINKIVTDLQDYAKPLTPSLQAINLEDLMQRTVMSLEIPSDVTVRFEVLKPFPAIKTDASFIMRILTNLVRNGMQAMEEKGGEITLRAFPRESSVIIAVSDMGGGIPVEAQGRIFKPLFTTKSKGQGFGLAVVKKLTEALGGGVSFETKVGVGTTFIVELPQTATNGLA